MLNGHRHKSNHLVRKHPREEASPIHRPKIIHSSPARCAHVKRHQRTIVNVAAHQREVHPGERNSLLEKTDRYKRHAARIDMMHAKSAATFTQTSAGTSLGAIEHPLKPYPRIHMDWMAIPLQETQPRPRLLQRKIPTKANSLQQNFAVGNGRCGAHARCFRWNNPCEDVPFHGKSGSTGAPNALCPQSAACTTHFLSSSQCSTGSLSRWSSQRGPRH